MNIRNLQDKKVLVVGAGLSGLAVCHFLLDKGCQITLADSKKPEALPQGEELASLGVKLLLDNALPAEVNWDLIVKSPGVPPTTALMKLLLAHNIPMIGELELAYYYGQQASFVAITGTNGKTTTTSLLGYILQKAGLPVLVGGNIGRPLVESAAKHQGIVVAEVSSFQLENCYQFKPKVALLLNITPDHLDRHGDMVNYQAVKERIFACQDENDFAVLNYDDPLLREIPQRIKSKIIWFSRKEQLSEGVFAHDGRIFIALNGKKINLMSCDDIYIKGGHNLENALAAIASAKALNIQDDILVESLRTFPGVAHRLEFIGQKEGIIYINDSKGTNPDSTIKALEAYDAPLILLAGGRNKGSDFRQLMELIKQKVKLLVLLGEAAIDLQKVAQEAGFADYIMADSFEDAFAKAVAAGKKGDIIMLSP
ncbi:MAG: UDP-N-acetylmuramoyl-L-alanine--D-glutamate ligase, partial [Clostridiales bacterium]